MTSILERIKAVREYMREASIDYYYVPSNDAHNNEHLPACWQRRAWVTGFDGSLGDAVIGLDHAYLWVDSRYFLQAEQQLDPECVTFFKVLTGTPSAQILPWLLQQGEGCRVGVDPRVMTATLAQRWSDGLPSVGGELVAIETNLVDQAWVDQPAVSQHPISLHPLTFSGEAATDKIMRVRKALHQQGHDAHVVNALDAIAWLFNIRGLDVEYNPLVMSYAVITQDKVTLCMNVDVLTSRQRDYFQQCHVDVHAYDRMGGILSQLSGSVLVDTQSASWWMLRHLQAADVAFGRSPIALMKATKNTVELAGIERAHQVDAVALVRFWRWLESHWQGQTEVTLADQLEQFRRASPECRGLSFPTICGFKDHGAIVHYIANITSAAKIDDSSMMLLDSGGQYDGGTTDITRVFHLGEPTEQQKRHYTLVLKGHLALGRAVFPKGTCGEHLDALARSPLWQAHCDYGHGTGHGVGCYLCVHEGPQSISPRVSGVPLVPGMVVSNEPGFYLSGQYGIRIENLCCVVPLPDTESITGHGPFYGFNTLTVVPYEKKLIDVDLLTQEDIQTLDDYHQRINSELSTLITQDEQLWLSDKTSPMMR